MALPDEEASDLLARGVRIAEQIHALSEEALRVRDQHRAEVTAARESRVVIEAPPSVVEWFRKIIKNHPLAADAFEILPGINLGEVRAWMKAIDDW